MDPNQAGPIWTPIHSRKAFTPHMRSHTDQTACPFNAQEREYIRRELDLFFGTLPSLADGFQLRTWRSGPLAGQPPALRTIRISIRPLSTIDTPLPRAYFTERGLGAVASPRCSVSATIRSFS
jgi:hypothetical protein